MHRTYINRADTLFLSGNFKSMAFYNLLGSAAKKIVVTNRPGETLVIGDSNMEWRRLGAGALCSEIAAM